NVRAVGSLQGRERGGSRPGLVESHIDNLGAAVRLIAPMTLALGDGFTAWSDNFSGLSMAAAWTKASWAAALPSILPSALASVDTSVDEGEATLETLPIDTTETYTVEMFLTPWNGAWHGKYRIYLRMNNTTPNIAADGVMVELVMTGSTGAYTGKVQSVVGSVVTDYTITPGTIGSARPGWLSVSVTTNTVVVYFCGTQLISQAVAANAGTKVGFGMECTVAGGLCLANTFRVQYFSTGTVSTLRTMLIVSADGDLYREETFGRLTAVTSALTVRDDAHLQAAQSGQKLYLADYGDVAASGTDGSVAGTALDATGIADWTTKGILAADMVAVISDVQGTAVAGTYKIQSVAAGSVTLTAAAGTGNCSYRIERAPKVYDPLLNTISILTATDGQVPTGCPLICRFMNAIYMAGAEIAPHVWYKCRNGDELDWDYSQTDSQRAVAGVSSEAGVPGSAIVALIPHSDDYLIFGCRTSLWRLRGDPAYGGSLDSLSHTVGVIGPNAWCLGPAGEMVFLSLDGLYALPPGGSTYPISLSRETLPRELQNLNPDMLTVSLEYDIQGRGVHIYLTPVSSNSRVHWWMDWERKTFWPVTLHSDHEPTATCAVQSTAIEDSGVILGGRDGTLRRLSDLAETDCGEVYTTYAVMGPIGLARDAEVGVMISMDAVMAEDGGDVTWALRPSLTFEGSTSAATSDTGTWTDGINATIHPACRGQAFTLKITGGSGRRWGMEDIVATVREAGKRRIV
ncbi:MAG: hypothetical protein ACYDH4_11950, partial [Candidatus Cryosericum sp.]